MNENKVEERLFSCDSQPMRRLSFSHFDCRVDSYNWWRWLKIPSSHGVFVSCGRILSRKGRRVIRFRFGERNLYKVTIIILNMKKTNTREDWGEEKDCRTDTEWRKERKMSLFFPFAMMMAMMTMMVFDDDDDGKRREREIATQILSIYWGSRIISSSFFFDGREL